MNSDNATAVYRARAVVPMVGPPISDGAVAVCGNRITDLGPWREIRRRHAANAIDLGDHALLPGLINAHCHLDYTGLRDAIPRQRTFTEWVQAINARKSQLTDDDYLTAIRAGFAEAQEFGTTSIVNIESFPHLLRKIEAAPLRTWWCAEMIDVRARISPSFIAEDIKRNFAAHPEWKGGVGLSPHAPFTASPDLYREAASVARREGLVLTTHLAESRDETEMFRDARGPLFDLMTEIGRSMDDCGKCTPVAAMMQLGVFDQNWIVAHLNELDDDDFRLLAGAQKFHIAHCPHSHAFFGHTRFPYERLRELNFNICLGTDSLASNQTLSLFSEMREFRSREKSIAARELLEMVTLNSAKALGRERELGSVQSGAYADMIAIPIPTKAGDLYENVVGFAGSVPWVMVAGEVLTRF